MAELDAYAQHDQTHPRICKFARGGACPAEINNPLGARALYLYRDGRDTYFRLHGTNEPATIGKAVSSGCIRLINQDIIDLYDHVSLGRRWWLCRRDSSRSGSQKSPRINLS